MRPLFLISNDDGVHAPGLKALMAALAPLGDCLVVAPHMERSGSGQALSLTSPLRLEKLGPMTYAVEGTPADCVILALHRLVPRRPDFVISGINRGSNLGQDTLYSGTVAAAMEGCVHGIPAVAMSLRVRRGVSPLDYGPAATVARLLLEQPDLLALGKGRVLNVNVPDVPLADVAGVKVCGLGRRIYDAQITESIDPRGRPYYWIGGGGEEMEPRPNTDCTLLNENFVTITALNPDHADAAANAAMALVLEQPLSEAMRRSR